MNSKYTAKWLATVGGEPGDDKEALFLNRVVRYCPADEHGEERLEIEVDSRHAQRIIADLGLQSAKAVDTPAVKRTAAAVEATIRDEVLVTVGPDFFGLQYNGPTHRAIDPETGETKSTKLLTSLGDVWIQVTSCIWSEASPSAE